MRLSLCTFYPEKLIFVTYLGKWGYTSISKDTLLIKKGKMSICYGSIIYGQYMITLDSYIANNSELELYSNLLQLKRKITSTDDGHISPNKI